MGIAAMAAGCAEVSPRNAPSATVAAVGETATPVPAERPDAKESPPAVTETLPSPGPIPTATSQPTAAPGALQPEAGSPTVAPSAALEPTTAPTPEPTDQEVAQESVRIALQPVASARSPVFLTAVADGSGRTFVVEKPGVIRILEDGQLLDPPFLNISDRVNAQSSEQGLLGLAFPPNFSETGYLFVNYTDARGDTVISRFQAAADRATADPGSESAVMRLDQPAPNHNGGDLVFGPDGYLWIGTGDGGAANDRFRNGQNPSSLLGKMLRVDVTTDPSQPYLVPANNPWTASDWAGRDVRDEVWAVGLRNPWRYSFDRLTGDLWIADVGQNQYEEVNYVPAGSGGGLNFGWPVMEGMHCFPDSAGCDRAGLEMPVLEYDHTGRCSVTGGYVYRGDNIPALAGTYVFGDFCSGTIWGLAKVGAAWQSRQLLDTDLSISSFGEDGEGELYVLDLNGGIFRLTSQ